MTYQYCTIRNVNLHQIQNANNSLGKRVTLSNFVSVQGADALLDRGKLIGNHFEIILRNLKRIQRLQMKGENTWQEKETSLSTSHLDEMVERIKQGFINFYGEQRVGNPGTRSHVGVRSFDVGRAFLQRDFSKAIDLIMTGRSEKVYNPSTEEKNARLVWKTSGGDPALTIKAFPKQRSSMMKERDLLRGLMRYGDALEAVRCLPYSIRMFSIHSYQSFVWNNMATERVKRYGLRPVVGDLYLDETGSDDGVVRVVKDASQVGIDQIVLPLPGYSVQYPSNEIGECYRSILHEDGIDLSNKDPIPEATAKGSYRKLMQRVSNLRWENVSDTSGDSTVSSAKLTFDLEKGCFATMLLRELMVTTVAREGSPKSTIAKHND